MNSDFSDGLFVRFWHGCGIVIISCCRAPPGRLPVAWRDAEWLSMGPLKKICQLQPTLRASILTNRHAACDTDL